MRTKTLVLTALGSLSALGLMAQTSTNVYSLNAVGYINVTIPPGFSMIADQLWASTGNQVSNILNDSDDSLDGLSLFQWNGTGFNTDTANNNVYNANGWQFGTITLNPGQATWIQSGRTTNFTITFVGTVPQGTNTVAITPGFNMISSPVPQAGDLVQDLGLVNFNDGDTVYAFNNGTGYSIYNANFNAGQFGYNADWLAPQSPPPGYPANTSTNYGDPQVAVGQGVWYQAASAISYTRVFSVNQ